MADSLDTSFDGSHGPLREGPRIGVPGESGVVDESSAPGETDVAGESSASNASGAPKATDAPIVRMVTMGCAKNEVDSDRMRALLEAAGFDVRVLPLSSVGADLGSDGADIDDADDDEDWEDDDWREDEDYVEGGLDDFFEDFDSARYDPWESDDPIFEQELWNAELSEELARMEDIPDVTIVNTCSFITGATQESIDAIFAVVDERAQLQGGLSLRAGSSKVVVSGCMPSRYGEELAREIPEVDAFVPVEQEDAIVEIVAGLLGMDEEALAVLSRSRVTALRTTGEPFAYVKISDGCDRFCSFCTIPYIRGRYESRPARQIIDEVAFLVEGGVREIVLIGQDTGIWGDDLKAPADYEPLTEPTLANLMAHLAETFPETWIRVMYLQPSRTGDDLLDVMAGHGNICNYLDIPLQHSSAKVIREMNREGSGEEYLQLLEHVRQTVPGVTLRTTMISGFPGETDDESDELVQFMRDAAFDFAGVFAYSREDGTVAGEREDQVDETVAAMRANEVREAIEECGLASASARVGQTFEVLVCGVADVDDEFDAGIGRAAGGFAEDGDHVEDGSASSDDTHSDGASGGDGFGDGESDGDVPSDGVPSSDASDDGESDGDVPSDGVPSSDASGGDVPAKLWGRAQFQAPEVDSVIYFEGPAGMVGSFAKVLVTDAVGYDLEGVLLA